MKDHGVINSHSDGHMPNGPLIFSAGGPSGAASGPNAATLTLTAAEAEQCFDYLLQASNEWDAPWTPADNAIFFKLREFCKARPALTSEKLTAVQESVIDPEIDYSLKPGDHVTTRRWLLTPLIVVDVNWALRAAALRLGPDGGVVVWPTRGLVKVEA